MDGLRRKVHTGTADHPRGCPRQNILEIKWEKAEEGEEEEEEEKKKKTGVVAIRTHHA